MSNELQKPAGAFAENAVRHLLRIEVVDAGGEFCIPDAEGHCITCSDEAQPARVVLIDLELGTAMVEIGKQAMEVDITLVEEVVPGDWLLVHGGVAIANLRDQHPTDEASDE